MKIYLFLAEKIISFSLPTEVVGSFSFDENPNEESKLINIEARESEWILYSTVDVSLIDNNSLVQNMVLNDDSFYVLKRGDKTYLIYVSDLSLNKISAYSYDNTIDFVIGGNNNANIQYPCPFLNNLEVRIHYVNDKLVLEKNNNGGVYINNKVVLSNQYYINIGEQINIYGLKIMVLNGMLLMNNPGGKLIILPSSKISSYVFPNYVQPEEIEIKDVDLYSKNDYFSKAPRIRRVIEKKVIKLNPPPHSGEQQELPMILTFGPMFTMGITSSVMLIDIINRISSGQATMKDSWTTLVTSSAMLTSMLLWPFLTRMYNKKLKTKKREELILKYEEYLEKKKQELVLETKLQKEILLENLITVGECLNIIKNRSMNFWDKRIDQNDFLVVRIGMGNELLDVEIEYPEEGFTVEEDELRNKADLVVGQFKYINDVPIGYSLYDNIITAVMGVNREKNINFVNNILLQLLTFYSYEDLKIVIFTNENDKYNWEYVKYLNHNFNNDKSFRFFASSLDSIKSVADFLNNEISLRNENNKGSNGEKKNTIKPHYIIVIDDYEKVKTHDFIKTLTELDVNLGFSVIIIEERLGNLPSKCNNFITIGQTESGVLKNSYEKQEQIVFKDEIIYGIDMMNIAKLLANVPIQFEESIKVLPDAISFMEMERVGKVEQLNVLNRWNSNDSTTSLKAEIGVDNTGELMYLDLHEKYHGPHGLIAGTTGSGKSEFIITYILSMCINYSPDDVAFILIDYKGGGLALAFENKLTGVSLPHLAGTITNLDKAEMDRTLVSIDSEVKRRQTMFNEARDKLGESTIDIYKYQRHYHDGRLNEPIPHLFIVCDEFAELKAQQPDFMDNLISVARIGRSLGVHLILATQKPSGVVNDQIWSNTKFRVCLKVQDESDSKEMLKRPEAAHLKQAGRFYLQVGYDELFLLGQSGWGGAKYYPSDKIIKQVDRSINFIDDCGTNIKTIREGNDIKIEAKGEQLAAIMGMIVETSKKINKVTRRLWLDNIPGIILVDNLIKKYNIRNVAYQPTAIIGEYDAPEKQEQGLVRYDYLVNGNTLVYGQNSSEIEMFFDTLIYSTIRMHTSQEINYYLIDYGSESLRKYQTLPHVGGIVIAGEEEKYHNLIKIVIEELNKRKKLFIDYGGEYTSYIRSNPNRLPIMTVIINNFPSFYEANQNAYDIFPELVRDSVRYGIVFIFAGSGVTNSIPGKIAQNFTNIYAYKLKDASDYPYLFNVRGKIIPRDIEGRGILNNGGLHEFQTSSITPSEEQLNQYLISFINAQKQLDMPKAKKIPTLPNIVRLEDVEERISDLKNVPIGIEKHTLEIATVDYLSNLNNIITSNKLENTLIFVKSLLSILVKIPDISLMIIDVMKELDLDSQVYQNYYVDDIENVIGKINEYVEGLIQQQGITQGIILIYNLSKFISKVEDTKKFKVLVDNLKKYEKISLVIVDDVKKIKDVQYESWYETLKVSDGLWIGKGITEQSILKTSAYNKEMQQNYNNDMGYKVLEGEVTLVKYIDFVTEEDDGNE